jgi:uncharacterized membrane-anchored protein
MKIIKGKVKLGKKTKHMIKRLNPHEIAIISHEDIDDLAAESLVTARVKAVINSRTSITGKIPNNGAAILLKAGIPIIDDVKEDIFEILSDGDSIVIKSGDIYKKNIKVAQGKVLNREMVKEKQRQADLNLEQLLDKFIENTLEFARKEKQNILMKPPEITIKTKIKGKHVLVVVRGKNYREDLAAIKCYIDEVKPVLIGVDGGGDALLEIGYKPDILVGDMDSVSDLCLRKAQEIIVHSYTNGRAPGILRIKKLGLKCQKYPYPGTSEDIALLMAYEKGASIIVAVGTHTNMADFLQKGRQGMASTFLVRLKVGSILVDAKGVNQLYHGTVTFEYLLAVVSAALLPLILIAIVSSHIKHFLRLFVLQVKVMLGM